MRLHRSLWFLAAALCAALQSASAQSCPPAAAAVAPASPAVIPIELVNNHVYVKVCVGDRPLEFILDTGAGQTFLDLNTARELGVKLGSSFSARGAGPGSIAGAQLSGASAVLSGSSISQPISAALDLSRLPPREGHRMDGILGYDFVARNVLALDYANSQMRVYDRANFHYEGTGTSLPLTFANNHPNIDADVRLADGELLRGRFVVDVGSSLGLALTKPFVEDHGLRGRVGPTLRRLSGGGVGGAATSDIGRVAGLRLGGLELTNLVANLYGDSAGVLSERGPWIGNIGGEILRRFTVYFDYGAKRMILEPNARFGDAFEADMSGMGVVVNGGGDWTVDYLVPSAPASDAGLEKGDVIVAVDGQPTTEQILAQLRQRFRKAGERVVLTIKRGADTKSVTVVTRRLV